MAMAFGEVTSFTIDLQSPVIRLRLIVLIEYDCGKISRFTLSEIR